MRELPAKQLIAAAALLAVSVVVWLATGDSSPPALQGPPTNATRVEPVDQPRTKAAYYLRVTDGGAKPVYASPRKGRAIGHLRQGALVPAKPADGSGCKDGDWYRVVGKGHVCAEDGIEVMSAGEPLLELPESVSSLAPRVEQPMPYEYGKVVDENAPRLKRLPTTRSELRALLAAVDGGGDDSDRLPDDLVAQWLKGTYLVAIAQRIRNLGTEFVQTSDGRYLLADQLAPKPKPSMVGEVLDDASRDLPLAFVPAEVPVQCKEWDGGVSDCGAAKAWSRAPVTDTEVIDGVEYVVFADETMLPIDQVRVADVTERPDEVPDTARWVHIDLSDQALVAYEGDEPRYATLISSGRPGTTETQPGTWRIERSYITKTMRGRDDGGPYEVQEVPWAMYYDGNFAVHGAYWHEEFGGTRSHGCVNVPPTDARWLYYWLDAQPPEGWHQTYNRQDAWVHITGNTPQETLSGNARNKKSEQG